MLHWTFNGENRLPRDCDKVYYDMGVCIDNAKEVYRMTNNPRIAIYETDENTKVTRFVWRI